MSHCSDRFRPRIFLALVAAVLLLAAFGVVITLEPAAAQLAGARPPATAAQPGFLDGLWVWLLERQRELTGAMTNAVKRLKTDSFWAASAQLALVSFLYGVFHAAGPGHGKFVISSYALANARTLRRGVMVSFLAAFFQALSAIGIVGVLAVMVKATSLDIRRTEAWLETASWGAIAVLGAWLLWRSVRGLWGATGHGHAHGHSHEAVAAAPVGHRHGHHHAHGHSHGHERVAQAAAPHPDPLPSALRLRGEGEERQGHGHGHGHHAGHAKAASLHAHAGHGHAHHDHAHGHGHHHSHAEGEACPDCGHVHMATPDQLEGKWSWREAISIALAIGIRPCTGALAVLIFSLGIGLFAAGIMATFAMAFGTAITVSALATLAVTSRDLAKRVSGGQSSPWAWRIEKGAAIAGSALVLVMGTAFFLASLSGTGTSPL